MENTDAASLFSEIEKLAEGFESRDFPFAAVCASKILTHLIVEVPADDEAVSIRWVAQARKSIRALETKDFGLASMCLSKAVKAYAGVPAIVGITAADPKAVCHYLEEIVIALDSEAFPNVGIYIRKLAAKLTSTLPAQASPAETPAELAARASVRETTGEE